jgi:uncharacterized protein (DUF305 family)
MPHRYTARGVFSCLAIVVASGTLAGAQTNEIAVAADQVHTSSNDVQRRISAEAPFLALNEAAMTKMVNGMSVKPTGDVDRDFVAMMVPHHQGAIDMAQIILRNGHNEQIKRLAQEIIVTQQEEIAAMRLALGEPLPPSSPAPTQSAPVSPR